jgi:glutamine amidotransferase
MIVIVDYGLGNLGSIGNMLKRIGKEAVISSSVSEVRKATRIILPGVGAFDNGVKNLTDRGLLPVLQEKAMEERIPILGICLGMQLLSQGSEEGNSGGLGWIDARTVRFRFDGSDRKLKVPHMGWNTVSLARQSCLYTDMDPDARFYFVHSYHVECRNEEDILTRTNYGIDFASSVARGNIFGVQFHPEKSHKFGMRLLQNFTEKA